MLPLLSLALTASILCATRAHNWLTHPLTYNTRYSTSSCRDIECVNACPEILSPEDMHNTYERPAVTWRRGEQVKIAWAKNNHHGGMFRVSLLPMPLMHDKVAHSRFAFEYGCWESGEYNCREAGDDCGTDNSEAYKRQITVPDVYEDGVYVLGYVWYGGLHYSRDHGEFADFYSCAFVRIQGGAPVASSFLPRWIPGDSEKIEHGMCETSAVTVGECDGSGCWEQRSFMGWASEFWKGYPAPITSAMVREGKNKHTNVAAQVAGIVRSDVVCPKMCGQCGGSNCNKKPGGGSNCCVSEVESSRRSCETHMPPCVRSGLPGMGKDLYRMPKARPVPPPPPAGMYSGAGPSSRSGSGGGSSRGSQGSSFGANTPESGSSGGEESLDGDNGSDTGSSPPPSTMKRGRGAVCRGNICCPKSCGRCGGRGCGRRPGGQSCCISVVKKLGRNCDRFAPPCIKNNNKDQRSSGSRQTGICKSTVCCAASCGVCGGKGCHRRQGGGENCCTSVIRRSKRTCDKYRAPCVRA